MDQATPQSLDLESANAQLDKLPVAGRIEWAKQTFGDRLFATTSAGRDAALLWHALSNDSIPVVFINTGFLHPDTLTFKEALAAKYPAVELIECGPTSDQLKNIANDKIWETDPARFMELTKHEPLAALIKRRNMAAVMSAIHRDQTGYRAGMPYIKKRRDGTYRIHPFLDWTNDQVAAYIAQNDLPINQLPLLTQGISHRQIVYHQGQIHIMPIAECGLHVEDGKVVRTKTTPKRDSSPPVP